VSAAPTSTAALGVRRDPRQRRTLLQLLLALGVFVLLFVLFAQQELWGAALRWLFPENRAVLFQRATLLELSLQHLQIVGLALALVLTISLPLSVWVTRPQGRAFLPLVSSLLSVGQTFPPIAVLALALPTFGFGLRPTLIALVAYGLLPVTRNAIAGLEAVPATLKEAATGMGMSPWERLFRLELPLATRVILAGARTSTVYTVGTATVAPIIGAGGLGVPIIAGLTTGNLAYVLEGAVPVALLALTADFALGRLEVFLTPEGVR